MNRMFSTVLMLILVAASAGAGYWWGTRQDTGAHGAAESAAGKPLVSSAEGKKKILYYRNPMGLPDTSPVPKKDSMGMDYVPVYEGEDEQSGGTVKISLDKVQKLGVKTATVTLREMSHTVRAVGTIELDERQVYAVSPKFEGWIERLHVNTTGQQVARGQPLMEVYSPDLITAQQEYLIARKGVEAVREGSPEFQASMQQLVTSALQRLRNWDISDEELNRLEKEGTARQTVTLRSPVSGVVLEKPPLKGIRFMPGEALYKISNLSSLWLLADVFEQDLALVRQGQPAKITVNAYPGKSFVGKVAFLYPTLTPETRTVKVRVELANRGGLLKPAMYASVEFLAGRAKGKVLTVPDSAVLDSGTRQIVLVQRGEGTFEPRQVKLGMYGDGYVEVLEGLTTGETVVTSANFLIDAESNLRAALGSFGSPGQTAPPAAAAVSGEVHRADGTLRAIDPNSGRVTIEHGAIPTLKWPAMTMDFQVQDKTVLKGMKPGERIEFALVPGKPGEFVVSRMSPAGRAGAAPPPAGQDLKGH
jgi:Cu(I)/Ag(I) efflux system membrane fusion protein